MNSDLFIIKAKDTTAAEKAKTGKLKLALRKRMDDYLRDLYKRPDFKLEHVNIFTGGAECVLVHGIDGVGVLDGRINGSAEIARDALESIVKEMNYNSVKKLGVWNHHGVCKCHGCLYRTFTLVQVG